MTYKAIYKFKVHGNRNEMNGNVHSQQLPAIQASYHNQANAQNLQNPNGYYLPRQYLKNLPIMANNNGFVISNSIKKNQQNQNTNNNNLPAIAGNRQVGNSEAWSKPRLITIVRATDRPRKKITILLNRKALHSFEQFVFDISDAFGLPQWKNDKIRRLYTIKGKRVQGISDFFRDDDMYIGVSGKEPLKAHLIQDLLNELYPDNEQYAQILYKEWESSRSRSRAAKPRHSSMDRANISPGINSNATNNKDSNNSGEGENITPEVTRRGHYSVDFDENGRKKSKNSD